MVNLQHVPVCALIFISGFLTNHRYRSSKSIYLFYRLRICPYFPLVLLTSIWTWIIYARSQSWIKIIANLSWLTSLFTIYPYFPDETLISLSPTSFGINAPFYHLGSAFLMIWIVYPLINFWIYRISIFLNAVVFISMTVLIPIAQTAFLYHQKSPSTAAPGTALWFLHPIFTLPKFLAGVSVSNIILSKTEEPKFTEDSIGDAADHLPRSQSWLQNARKLGVGLLVDVVIVSAIIFFTTNHVTIEPLIKVSLAFPLVAAVITIIISKPDYGAVNWLLSNDAIHNCLPGKSATIITFVSFLILDSLPKDVSAEIRLQGAGFFFILFLFFLITISIHNYVVQPYHVWLATSQGAGEALLDSPNFDNPYPHDRKLLLNHMQKIPKPSSIKAVDLWAWFSRVFITSNFLT